MARYRNLQGIERVAEVLRDYPREAQERIVDALNVSAEEIRRDAVALAPGPGNPYGTGELRSAIEVRTSLDGFGATGAVGNFATQGEIGPDRGLQRFVGVFPESRGSPGWYAAFVEFGTSPRVQGAQYTQRSGRKKKALATHPGTAPQPFMFPAWNANRRKIISRIRRAITAASRAVLKS